MTNHISMDIRRPRFHGFPSGMRAGLRFAIKTGKFDVVQTTYSFPIGGSYRDWAVKRLHEAGIGVIAMKVVVALTGWDLKTVDNPPATKGEGPLAGIKWVRQNPAIGTTVPHMRTIWPSRFLFSLNRGEAASRAPL